MTSKIPWLVTATAITGTVILSIVYWPQLPEKVASHFGAGGQPNGWMSKGAFVTFNIVLQLGLAVVMFGTGVLSRMLPTSMLNIPNREYWLADERREQTLAETESMLGWIGAGTAVFLLIIFWLVFEANAGEDRTLNATAFWIATVAFIVGLLVYCFVKVAKYYRVPDRG
jgi:uncharacterized membrane protein